MTAAVRTSLALALAGALLASACSLPRMYRLTVQQGNVITQEMVDSLKPGMTHEQVAYVMGEPVMRNPFDNSRWDYVYTLRVPGYVNDRLKLSLFFVDGELSHFVGDLKPSGMAGEEADGEAGTSAAESEEDEAAASATETAAPYPAEDAAQPR